MTMINLISYQATKLYEQLALLEPSKNEPATNQAIQRIAQEILNFPNYQITNNEREDLNRLFNDIHQQYETLKERDAFSCGWIRKIKKTFGIESQTQHLIILAIEKIRKYLSANLNPPYPNHHYQNLIQYGFNKRQINKCIKFIKKQNLDIGFKIPKKTLSIPNTIIYTQTKNIYLLFTNKWDSIAGKGAFKTAKYCVDLDSLQKKVVAITKRSRIIKNQKDSLDYWEKILKLTRSENQIMKTWNQCPYLASVQDYFEEVDSNNNVVRIYSFMKKYRFGNLRNVFITNPFIFGKQFKIINDMIQGVKFLHEKNLVHRDIKPENILITTSRSLIQNLQTIEIRAAITDFASLLELSDDHSSLSESDLADDYTTDSYKAPELLQKSGYFPYSKKSDIWALGCTIVDVLMPSSNYIYSLNELQPPDLEYLIYTASQHYPDLITLLTGMLKTDPHERWDIHQVDSYFKKIITTGFR